METANDNKIQKTNSNPKPLLVKIIAVISIVFGVFTFLGFIFIMVSLGETPFSRLSEALLSVAVTFSLVGGGIGLLHMRKWGLYLLSPVVLYLVVSTTHSMVGVWPPWRWFELDRVLLILALALGYIVGGTFVLIYLWRMRNRFN